MNQELKGRPKIRAETVRRVLTMAGHRCSVCGESCPLERAHIIPWSQSQDHREENLICLCANCHQRADSEKWGKATLRFYKENPWILRKKVDLNRDSEPQAIRVSIDMEIASFEPLQRRLLAHAIASFLEIPIESISIGKVSAGSLIVELRMPRDHARYLVDAFLSREPALLAHLEDLPVTSIEFLDPEKLLPAPTGLIYVSGTLPGPQKTLVLDVLRSSSMAAVMPTEEFDDVPLVSKVIIDRIRKSDGFLGIWTPTEQGDVSPWRLWELGVAQALGKPVVLMLHEGLDPEFWNRTRPDSRFWSIRETDSELSNKLRAVASTLIQEVQRARESQY